MEYNKAIFLKNCKLLCKREGIGHTTALGKIIGKRDGADYIKRLATPPNADIVLKIVTHFKCNFKWLVANEGSAYAGETNQTGGGAGADVEHIDIVGGFKDRKWARSINTRLREIEDNSPERKRAAQKAIEDLHQGHGPYMEDVIKDAGPKEKKTNQG